MYTGMYMRNGIFFFSFNLNICFNNYLYKSLVHALGMLHMKHLISNFIYLKMTDFEVGFSFFIKLTLSDHYITQ